MAPSSTQPQRTAFEDVLGNGAFGAAFGDLEGLGRKERLYELLQQPEKLFDNEGEEDEE